MTIYTLYVLCAAAICCGGRSDVFVEAGSVFDDSNAFYIPLLQFQRTEEREMITASINDQEQRKSFGA
eukprot:2349463-Ditylum_brightwellii.AAC.1